MKGAIKKISINGFKSIRELRDFELQDLNVIIGANGSGKSNLVQVFQMLMAMPRKGLQKFVLENGGADNFLYNGPRNTPAILMEFEFESGSYVGFNMTVNQRSNSYRFN
nr:AAA family ATPase [Chlorobaculum limnaeum]